MSDILNRNITSRQELTPDGKKTIDNYQTQRLAVCNKCPLRWNTKCSLCGCLINDKVQAVNAKCLAGKW